jgi:TPR repeat protein
MLRFIAAAFICVLNVHIHNPAFAQPTNFADAMAWYETEAAKGSAKAQFLLGLLSERGANGRKKDPALAFKWFLKAAEQGHPQAQYKVAAGYNFGEGIVADPKLAFLWYRRAAGQGVAEAQHNLAHMLLNGIGTLRSADKAARLYAENARHGFGPSQLALAFLYLQGIGVAADMADAWAWFRAAETRGVAGVAKARADIEKQLSPNDLKRAKILAKPRLRK